MSFHKDNQNLQVKLENEKDIYDPGYKLPGSPANLPYRKIWDVAFYNNKAEIVSLHEIAKSGPFVGVASAVKSEGVKEQFKNEHFKISLHPVIEYSLELPYGRQARVWVTTETACYRIMSVSANYISFWQAFYDMVCFAGHVVNILLNYSGHVVLVKLVGKVSKLSGLSREETFSLFREHKKFIHDLLKEQNLPSRVRKEYNALQSNSAIWEQSWADHLNVFESKLAKKESPNILSFFRSKSSSLDENLNDPTNSLSNSSTGLLKKTAISVDETSSLLSISEDESATYVECPYNSEEIEIVSTVNISERLKSSFTCAKLSEWRLPEIENSRESFYTCPLCSNNFKTTLKDSLMSFKVHLKAHSADCKVPENSEQRFQFSDFETRFSNFRIDLQKIIVGRISYDPIPLLFSKSFIYSSCNFTQQPFSKYPILESENPVMIDSVENPIKAFEFNAPVTMSSFSSPVSVSQAPTTTAKKPRVRKVKANPNIEASTDTISNRSSSPESSIVKRVSLTFKSSPNSSSLSSLPTSPVISKNNTSIPLSSNDEMISKTDIKATIDDDESSRSMDLPSKTEHVSDHQIKTGIVSPNFKSISPLSNAKPIPIEIISAEDSLVIPPFPSKADLEWTFSSNGRHLGCKHYKVNCKFYAECCGKWFTCRFCHDDVSDHKVNRFATKFCLCMFCGVSQKASGQCINSKCSHILAQYYCDLCKFWDNELKKPIFHCEKCSLCVMGIRNNLFHCESCCKCIPKTVMNSHICIKTPLEPSEKRLKLDQQIPPPTESKIEASMDQVSYLNYLKNSLSRLSRTKSSSEPNSLPEAVPHSTEQKPSGQNCWNCLHALTVNSDGSLTSKFCPHCSAVIE